MPLLAMTACTKAEEVGKKAISTASSAASVAGTAATNAASGASTAVSSAFAPPSKTLEVPAIGSVVLEGHVAQAYEKAGGQEKLGLPTAQPKKIGEGVVQDFVNGSLYYSPETKNAYLLQGEILKVYEAHGGAAGHLGFPTADEVETAGGPHTPHGGWISEFQHGEITWLNQGDGTFKETITQK